MGKDPAFLFYSDKWITGTADMLPEEKGVYIDLLAFQHTKGLPTDTRRLARMVSMGHDEFLVVWQTLKSKFDQMDNQMVNQTLNQIIIDREVYANKLGATGTFAACIKTCGLGKSEINKIKKAFDIQLFKGYSKEETKEKVREWFNQMVNQIEHHKVNQMDVQMDNNLKDKDINTDIVLNKETDKKQKGPKPEIDDLMLFMKEANNGSIDGTVAKNRQYCNNLLKKITKDFPNADSVESIKHLITKGKADKFWASKITSFQWLYYNFNKLLQNVTEKTGIEPSDLQRELDNYAAQRGLSNH